MFIRNVGRLSTDYRRYTPENRSLPVILNGYDIISFKLFNFVPAVYVVSK
jgi:hypothetical protein